MKTLFRTLGCILKIMIFLILIIISFFFIVFVATTPSNNRDWSDDQITLPYADIQGDQVHIYNIRNFTYASTTNYTQDYYDKSFNIKKLKKVWYIVEPFSGIPGSAHTFLSFEFEDKEFVSVSVEIRKEKGESFHPIKGLFNQYEIMYVWADEKDAIKLRSNYRKDLVYVYPIKTSTEKAQALFLDMLTRTNRLQNKPEFYNTITNTCTTNIVDHINKLADKKISKLNMSVILPGSSDKLAYNLGFIDTNLIFEEARKKFYINNRAEVHGDSKDFSLKIRE